MTEPEKIEQIEQALAALEKEVCSLKGQLAELRQSQSPAPVQTAISSVSAPRQAAPGAVPGIAGTSFPANNTNNGAPPVYPHTVPQTVSASAAGHPDTKGRAPASGTKAAGQTVPKPVSSSRFEENLGGKVMGIVAAVLVFVGLFLFGSILYEQLGDTARITLLFLISFVILGAGLFLERKKQSWFTTSLIGCGFGAVYISLFITTLYYGRLTTETLYILLVFWLTGVGLYVFYRKSCIAALLGQAGITFSVLFGSFGADTRELFDFLCIYSAAISLLYLWTVLWRFLPSAKEKPYPWIHLVAAVLNVLQLLCLSSSYQRMFGAYGNIGRNWPAGIILCLYCLVLPVFFLLRQRLLAGLSLVPGVLHTRMLTKENFPLYKTGNAAAFVYALYQIVCCVVFHTVTDGLLEAEVPAALFCLTGILLLWLFLEFFGTVGTEGQGACIISAVATFLLIQGLPRELQYLILAAFAVIAATFGLLGTEYPVLYERDPATAKWSLVCKKQNGRWLEKFTAVLLPPLLLLFYRLEDGWGAFWYLSLFGLFFFMACFCFLYKKGRTHRFAEAWKKELYLSFLFHSAGMTSLFCDLLPAELSQTTKLTALLTVLTLMNSIAFYSRFRRLLASPGETGKSTTVLLRIIHSALWLWGLVLFRESTGRNSPVLCVWLLLLTLFLCGSGMYEQYKNYREQKWLGVYFGLRITVYLLVVLTAFQGIEGYVISCALLLLAIAAVLAGFPLRLAPLRIYGLCLAMFAVIKLLMADLRHDNSMETVLCFLGAGVLCFAINFIYNHVKKRFERLDEQN